LYEVLEAVLAWVNDNVELSAPIKPGPLPLQEGGLGAEILPGRTESVFLNKTRVSVLPVELLSKQKEQKAACAPLDKICQALERLKNYPGGEGFRVINITVTESPYFRGLDAPGKGFNVFSATIKIQYYQQ
jgi:hypothetical protein